MGMSPAPAIANTSAFWYEFQFLKRACEACRNNSPEALRYSVLLHYAKFTKRCIDDIAHMVDPNAPNYLIGVEPLLVDSRQGQGSNGIFPRYLI